MGQLEDIERLRKKRNRRQNLKRLGTFLLVLAIFFGIWFVWEKIKQTSLAEQLAGGFAELGSGSGDVYKRQPQNPAGIHRPGKSKGKYVDLY